MSEVNSAGYADLRTYVRENWQVQLYDGSQATVLTLEESDSRVSVNTSGSSLVYTIQLAGADADITVPQTLSGGRLVKGGTVVAPNEAFAEGDATLGGDADEVTVTSTFTMPS